MRCGREERRRRGRSGGLLVIRFPAWVRRLNSPRADRLVAEVTDAAVSPADLAATAFHLLGVDPAATLHDALGRPFPLCEGTPVRGLVG